MVANDPEERVAGQNREERLLDPQRAMIAALEMRQFVGADGAQGLRIRRFEKAGRQDKNGPEQSGDQRLASGRAHPDLRRRRAEAPGRVFNDLSDGRRDLARSTDQAMQAQAAPGQPDHPDESQQTGHGEDAESQQFAYGRHGGALLDDDLDHGGAGCRTFEPDGARNGRRRQEHRSPDEDDRQGREIERQSPGGLAQDRVRRAGLEQPHQPIGRAGQEQRHTQ